MQQRRIALTGGIATGKTTVSQYLVHQHRLPVLDADLYARLAVAVGSPILTVIGQRYGSRVFQADGSLNREQLGQIVFADAAERHWLEQQIHPVVRQQFQAQLQTAELQRSPIVILDIPLLFEAEMTDLATEIWVVVCSAQQQLQRLMARNQMSLESAQARIQSQWPLERKIAAADVVLSNTSSLEALYQHIDAALHECPDH